jgi:hypothetical protein
MTQKPKRTRGPNRGELIRLDVQRRAAEAALRALAPEVAARPDLQAAVDASLEDERLRVLADLGADYDLAIKPIFFRAAAIARHP